MGELVRTPGSASIPFKTLVDFNVLIQPQTSWNTKYQQSTIAWLNLTHLSCLIAHLATSRTHKRQSRQELYIKSQKTRKTGPTTTQITPKLVVRCHLRPDIGHVWLNFYPKDHDESYKDAHKAPLYSIRKKWQNIILQCTNKTDIPGITWYKSVDYLWWVIQSWLAFSSFWLK